MNSTSLKIIRSIFAVIHSCGLFLAAFSVSAQAQESPLKTERYSLKVETLASGLVSPWSVALLPDGLILVTEKPGSLRVLRDGKLLAAPVSGLPKVTVRGQGGLLDVVAHPGYRQNRLVYWSFAAGNESEVVRSRPRRSTVSVTSAV